MKKWLSSAGHAFRGVVFLFTTERNFRIETGFAVAAIAIGLWLGISAFEFCIVLLCISAVLGAEALNSAVERLADVHTRETHPEIKRIKDIAAGAVLIVAFISLVIGIVIFIPRL